jgi:hypothetical protein
MKIVAAFALVTFLAAPVLCQEPAEKKPTATDTRPSMQPNRRMGEAKPLVMEKDREVYGAEVQIKEATKLEDVIKNPKEFKDRKLKITGTIVNVCQKRGCWMNIKDGDAKTMVKFTDYGFFVPLDVDGRTVTVECTASEKEISEAMRRHYAQDAGKSKEEIEKIKGSEKGVMLIADGVEIGPKVETKVDPKAAESKPVEKK